MTSVSSSILTALGAGSGIDTASLVSSLVSATREPRQTVITNRQTLNNSRISALASAKSSLNTFADALNSLLAGTGYSGTPASNDPSIVAVSALPGGTPAGLPAQIEVKNLATSRTLVSAVNANSDASSGAAATVGTGTLLLKVGSGTAVPITIDSTNNSYTGLAAAINKSGAGVTASVITDSQGTRLMLKGPTGAANDISLTVSGSTAADPVTGADLASFAWANGAAPAGSTVTSASDPADATIVIDGVQQKYASNTIDTAIANLRIDLNKAAPGTTVTLASSEPTTSMRDLMVEFTDAYNTLMKALNTATSTGTDSSTAGVLNGESSIRDMKRQLSQMVSAQLTATGTFKTLNDLGVSTNRDGTLTLDTKQLDKAIAADPAAITQMLNPSVKTATNIGLAGLMDQVRDNIEKDGGPLASSQEKYQKLADDLTDQLDKLDTQMTDYQAQLTKVYAAMETRMSAFKATQSYLQQQVALWSKSDN